MLRDPSPIFDSPEIPSARRTKPLPKRRRTSSSSPSSHSSSREATRSSSVLVALPELSPASDGSDGLISSESLLALQSYYMPILGGMRDLLKHESDGGLFERSTRDYRAGGVFSGLQRAAAGRVHEEDDGEGEYLDHFQQPGNTKKRKVPANLAAMGPGHELGGGGGGIGEDEPTDRAILTGRPDYEYEAVGVTKGGLTEYTSAGVFRKKKMSKATLAGLQHKEMLRSRKRQLAAVLGALTHGDTLALDQALSANYPFAHSGFSSADLQNQELIKVRLSRRPLTRLARAYKTFRAQLPPSDAPRSLPGSDFSFTFYSATSDRLVATKEEVSSLHSRFEAELSRQAAKAAEVARQTTAMLSGGPATKRSAKQGRTSSGRGVDLKATALEQSLGVTPQKASKKKKRSALANASNPHHLRNYVPSRLPNSGQANAAQALLNVQNLLSPLPVRFLSADIPPRRRRKSPPATIAPITNPIEEWICPFCEYDLFFGDDMDYQRAVNNRKKILRRRLRARERAAAAASGVAAAMTKNTVPAAPTGEETDSADESPRTTDSLAAKRQPPAGNPAKMKGHEDNRGRAGLLPQTALG